MARTPKPWYRKERGEWAVQIRGKRHVLAKGPRDKTKKEAERAFHALMASLDDGKPPPPASLTVDQLIGMFLGRPKSEIEDNTRKNYRDSLRGFRSEFKNTRVASLKPHQVKRWYEAKATWSESYRGAFVQNLKACVAWGVSEGYLDSNPIKALKRPPIAAKSAERRMTAAQLAALIEHAGDQNLRDLIVFIASTGCRPSEAFRIEAKDVDLENHVVTLAKHKTARKTKRPRTIVLHGIDLEIVRRLVAEEPDGPIFKNTARSPWTKDRLSGRIGYLRKKGLDIPKWAGLYSARHLYITDLLSAGVAPAIVAALAGNSLAVISRHYDHTGERTDVLREALAKIRDMGRPGDGPDRA